MRRPFLDGLALMFGQAVLLPSVAFLMLMPSNGPSGLAAVESVRDLTAWATEQRARHDYSWVLPGALATMLPATLYVMSRADVSPERDRASASNGTSPELRAVSLVLIVALLLASASSLWLMVPPSGRPYDPLTGAIALTVAWMSSVLTLSVSRLIPPLPTSQDERDTTSHIAAHNRDALIHARITPMERDAWLRLVLATGTPLAFLFVVPLAVWWMVRGGDLLDLTGVTGSLFTLSLVSIWTALYASFLGRAQNDTLGKWLFVVLATVCGALPALALASTPVWWLLVPWALSMWLGWWHASVRYGPRVDLRYFEGRAAGR